MESLRSNLQRAYKENFSSSVRNIPKAVQPAKQAAATAAIKLAEATHDLPQIWHEAMSTDVKTVKYRKSFRRLTKREVCGYDVIAYRDLDPMWEIVAEVLGNQFDKTDLDLDNEDAMAALWDTLDAMSQAAQLLADTPVLERPTSHDIADEIQAHKRQKAKDPAAPTTDPAAAGAAAAAGAPPHDLGLAQWLTFRHAVQAVASAVGTTVELSREGWEATFDAVAEDTVDGGDTVIALLEKDEGAPVLGRSARARALVGLGDAAAAEAHADAWVQCGKEFKKLYNMRQLQKSLPPTMMSKIESHASELAMKLQRGDMDMADVNMASIGEAILGGCTDTDIDSLSNNIGTLLPTLNKLASSVKDDSRSAGLIPESMQNILSQAQTMSGASSSS